MILPVPMAEFIQRNFKDVGIEMKLTTSEWATHTGNFLKGLPAGVGGLWIAFLTEGEYRMENAFSSKFQPPNGFDSGWYVNQKFDDLAAQARVAKTEESRVSLYKQAQQVAIDDAVWAYVVHDSYPKAYNNNVKGFVNPHSWFLSLRNVWLDQ
jgi:peptide/nickel transport system substrate-binding protein